MAISVSSLGELQTALQSASGGETILLEPGDYGKANFSDLDFDPPVTITSADPDAMASFGEIKIWKSHGMTFDRIEVDFVPDMNTVEWDSAIRMDYSSQITISNAVIVGGPSVNGIDPNSPAGSQGDTGILGYPTASGIKMVNSQDIAISENDISEFEKGVVYGKVTGLTISDNEFHDLRSSPMTGETVSDVVIENNHAYDIFPWKLGGQGDHADFIHIFSVSNTTGVMDNITIRNNFFEQGDGAPIFGIYIEDGATGYGYTNVTIEDNLIHNGSGGGIRLEHVVGGSISNNTLLPTDDSGTSPGIIMTENTENLDVDNNVVAWFTGASYDAAAANNISITNNLLVQNTNPNGENYLGDLYINGQVANGDIWDFTAVPDGPADGVGATMTNWGVASETPVGYITDAPWSGLDMKVHTIELEGLVGPDGPMNLSGASVSWDFGDGGAGSGLSAVHEYDSSGAYKAVATVTLANGNIVTVNKTIVVETPDALALNFEDGIGDLSEIYTPVEQNGSYTTVTSDYGKAISLSSANSRLLYEGSNEMTNNPEFSFSTSFAKESLSDAGKLMYFSGTGVLTVGEQSITFGGKTDTGDSISLSSRSADVNDTDWHHITVTYSEDSGTATLYLDGEVIDEQTGLTGGQFTTEGHDMAIGGRFGESFTGLIDNVSFVRGEMSPEEVAYTHGALMGLDVEPPAEEPPAPEPPAQESPSQEPPAPPSEEPPAPEPPVENPPTPEPPVVEEPPVEEPPTEEPRNDDPGDRGAPREAVQATGSDNFLSKFLDILLGIFGLGSDDDTPSVSQSAQAQVSDNPSLEDLIPVSESLDEEMPDASDADGEDGEFDLAA